MHGLYICVRLVFGELAKDLWSDLYKEFKGKQIPAQKLIFTIFNTLGVDSTGID